MKIRSTIHVTHVVPARPLAQKKESEFFPYQTLYVCMYVALNGAVPLHQPAYSELDFSLSELATRIKRELTYYYVLSSQKKKYYNISV